MKRNHLHYLSLLLTALFFLIISCEPISVSVNSKGEIAFTRSEGVFYYDSSANKLFTLHWSYGSKDTPIIVRWSPNDNELAFTVKDNYSSTSIFTIDRNGKNLVKRISTNKVVTQLEWSPDGSYLSYAQAGADSDMSVADLGLISLKDNMSRIFQTNTGDIHFWADTGDLVLMKVKVKNEDNSSMYSGALSIFHISSNQLEEIVPVIIDKNGNLHGTDKNIYFTAYHTGEGEFNDEFKSTYPFMLDRSSGKVSKLINFPALFVQASPDEKSVMAIIEEGNEKKLAVIDVQSRNTSVVVQPIKDKISANSSDISVYPAWYDNSHILYFDQSNVYGSNGQALRLMKVNKKSGVQENLQVKIEGLIDDEIMKRGGY